MSFRRHWVPTLMAVPMLVVLLGLGTWQVQRHGWKTDLNTVRAARLAAAAMPLPASIADGAAVDLQRVVAEGRFDHGREMRLQSRSRNQIPGMEVITPLLREGGRPILVNRGFVPHDRVEPASRPAAQVEGPVRIEGVLRLPAAKGAFVPENDPARGLWFSIDVPAMSRAAGLEAALPVLLELGGPAPAGGLPAPLAPPALLRNDHLAYAFTWFTLAGALVVVYLLYQWRNRRTEP